MKTIDELRGRHAGRDIWIIGAGASLQFVAPEFFRDKLTIGINYAFRRFPCTYTIGKDGGEWVNEAIAAGQQIVLSEFNCARPEMGRNDYPAAYLFRHAAAREDDAVDWSAIGTERILITWSTVTSAMHLACEMGAANVILCGIDGGAIDGEFNYSGYYGPDAPRRFYYWKFIGNVMARLREARERIQQHYGCQIYSLSPFAGLTTDGHHFRSHDQPPRCRHCNDPDTAYRCEVPGGHARFFECSRCGCFTSDIEFRDVAEIYHRPGYLDHHGCDRQTLLQAVENNFQRINSATVPERSSLDVGCLEGALMERLTAAGWDCFGWDVAETARTDRVTIGTDFRAVLMGRQFGAVVSREVLEHVPDHRQHVRELAAAVMPGGILHVQTPRPHADFTDGIAYQTTHLILLEPSALRQLLVENGLRIEHSEIWRNGQLWQARKLCH